MIRGKTKFRVAAMFCFSLVKMLLAAQNNTITLKNPSFEDVPRPNQIPLGWVDCGFPNETEPDIHPGGFFGVNKPANVGRSYLGLVVRENYTWERVGQKLEQPMQSGTCYTFSIYLAKSPNYQSNDLNTKRTIHYTYPAKLRIFGGFSPCQRDQLLAESPLISNENWQQFHFRFQPQKNYSHLTFEAFYQIPDVLLGSNNTLPQHNFPYNGNLLLDHASPIVQVDCKNPVIVAIKTPIKQEVQRPNTVAPTTSPKTYPIVVVPPAAPKEISLPPPAETSVEHFLDTFKRFHQGQILQMRSITFVINDSTLNSSSSGELAKLSQFLSQNPGIIIEIGGHTNGLCEDNYCNTLSLGRARAVATFLINKGTDAQRLQVKGYGKTKPLSLEKNAQANQRVEIRIMDIK